MMWWWRDQRRLLALRLVLWAVKILPGVKERLILRTVLDPWLRVFVSQMESWRALKSQGSTTEQ